MASTTVSSVGGMVIITQVIPHDEKASIPLQTTPTTLPTPPTATAAPLPAPAPATKTNDMTAMFLRGEPQALGLVQIFLGVLCVLFSLTAVASPVLLVHAPLCAGVLFLVSGSLALVSKRRTSFRLILATLVSNLLSVVLSLVGVAYVCWLLADWLPSTQLCTVFSLSERSETRDPWTRCRGRLWLLNRIVLGLRGLLVVLLLLQLCVALTLCVFCGKAIRCRRHDDAIKVMENATSGNDSGALLDNSDEDT